MACRTMLLLVVAMWSASPAHAEQASPPKLTKTQRATLQALVTAVDNAAAAAESSDAQWQTHLLRTSDGAHYVAFTLTPAQPLSPQDASSVYVRLATRADAQFTSMAERSAVMEWLKGMRSDPLVARQQRGIAFGEMPTFGAGAIAARGPGQQASDLALLALERERARERKEAAEKERKAALEGTATRPRDPVFPFEDFSIDAPLPAAPNALRRSVTAGPGEYDLYVAFTGPAPKGRAAAITVVKRPLRLPPATASDLTLSSIIVADAVSTRDRPYPPDQQSAHPYVIGAMEIEPSLDTEFTNDDRLAVVLQVLNPRPNETGKPDLAIGFELFRITSAGDQSVGLLNPQYYNASTLPADFDLTKGHPMFAAMAAPLKTLPRGDYRLKVSATDKLAGRNAVADTTFRIVGTPATLLATAPVTIPLRRELLLEPPVLRDVAAHLRSERMSAALSAALDAAAQGRYIDLLRDDTVDANEQSVRTTLRGVGLYGVGDSRMAATMLRRAIDAAPNPVAHLYMGACRALEGNDRDAVASWQAALDGGLPSAIVAPLLIDGYLRLGDLTKAGELAQRAGINGAPDPAFVRGSAAVLVAQGREIEAIPLLEQHLATHRDDQDAQYVMLHALFASFVHGKGVGTTAQGKERFQTLVQAYIDAKGRNAAIVGEWVAVIVP